MEEACTGNPYVFENAPALERKLRLYSSWIRKVWDTEDWPEKTMWETALPVS